MATFSEALKHPVLLAIIPAALGLGGTIYTSSKDKPVDKVSEKTLNEAEKIFWASIQPPNDSEENYCAYLEKYPKGEFIQLALPHCSAALEAKEQAEAHAAELAEQKAEAAAQ